MESAQKKVGPIFTDFIKDLAEKYGQKDKDGKPIMSGNGLPQADADHRAEYDDMLDEFMLRTIEIDIKRLPLEFFSHIQKTPMDWECLEQISQVSYQLLDDQEKAKNTAHDALRSIQGGQMG